jgi:hypothetical protein
MGEILLRLDPPYGLYWFLSCFDRRLLFAPGKSEAPGRRSHFVRGFGNRACRDGGLFFSHHLLFNILKLLKHLKRSP